MSRYSKIEQSFNSLLKNYNDLKAEHRFLLSKYESLINNCKTSNEKNTSIKNVLKTNEKTLKEELIKAGIREQLDKLEKEMIAERHNKK